MSKLFVAAFVILSFSISAQISFNTGSAELDSELNDINNTAKSDMNSYKNRLGDLFNVGMNEIEKVLDKVTEPADAHLIFKVGSVTDKPVDDVLKSYSANRDKGWGAIAKDLGIKPGSAEFHALKGKSKSNGNGKGNSNGKGKKK